MVEEAETESRRVEEVPLHVDLLDGVVDVVGELRIVSAVPASLVLVGWNVSSVWNQSAQAIPRDDVRR